MIPTDDLRFSHFAFASQYVADQVLVRLLNSARQELGVFLLNCRGPYRSAQVGSHLFERYVHHVLPLGGTFECRDLETGELFRMSLSARFPYQLCLDGR